MALTTKKNGAVSRLISGVGGAQCRRPSWQWAREKMAAGWSGPGDWGSRIGSRDVLHTRTPHRPQKGGLCPHRTEMGKDLCISPVITNPGAGGTCGVRPVWVSSRPALLFKRSKNLRGKGIAREDWARGKIWWRKGHCSRGRKGIGSSMALKSFKA
ncbi:hypothetical protein GWK47_035926 [Chionoecetes opilio]|uniref:Uncharacterized protein n=1 Tax=Chionoecetes opilio TaxID=41210 RepID=A0A8J4YER3_CHIOP|nr:hypothetical protein GWK47_035926 [Chionoecetes opilio]